MKVVKELFHRLDLNNGFLESDPVLERFQCLKVKPTGNQTEETNSLFVFLYRRKLPSCFPLPIQMQKKILAKYMGQK